MAWRLVPGQGFEGGLASVSCGSCRLRRPVGEEVPGVVIGRVRCRRQSTLAELLESVVIDSGAC